jgi:hypothetical protein
MPPRFGVESSTLHYAGQTKKKRYRYPAMSEFITDCRSCSDWGSDHCVSSVASINADAYASLFEPPPAGDHDAPRHAWKRGAGAALIEPAP